MGLLVPYNVTSPPPLFPLLSHPRSSPSTVRFCRRRRLPSRSLTISPPSSRCCSPVFVVVYLFLLLLILFWSGKTSLEEVDVIGVIFYFILFLSIVFIILNCSNWLSTVSVIVNTNLKISNFKWCTIHTTEILWVWVRVCVYSRENGGVFDGVKTVQWLLGCVYWRLRWWNGDAVC